METCPTSAPEKYLSALGADWADLIFRVGPCGLKPRMDREPYEALTRAIAYQQLHAKAAEAILGRFLALFPHGAFPAPEEVLATEETLMRQCGFSASKIASIKGIAQGALDGVVPSSRSAAEMTDEALIQQLVSLRGVGRWTVEMLLIFSLGRPDVLPVDDFGVREGWRVLKGLPEQPKPKALAALGSSLSPYRSTAAWYLWRAAEMAKVSGKTKMAPAA